MTIKWNSSFELGVPELDREHKHLVMLINMLSEEKNKDSNNYRCLVAEFVQYAAVHFSREESIMMDLVGKWDGVSAHIREHRDYWKWTRHMPTETLEESAKYLETWWTNHILNFDRLLVEEMIRRGMS